MALNSFHLFSTLPFDLRREIYMFATPPRVMHIKEDMSWNSTTTSAKESISASTRTSHPSLQTSVKVSSVPPSNEP
ncbi:hypothetical protein BDV06DRAFT_193010 [Aspergillus oleicola]